MQLFEKKHYLIFVRNFFSKEMKNRIFVIVDPKFVTRFIYKNIIGRHECFKRLIINDDFKNKKLVETFV